MKRVRAPTAGFTLLEVLMVLTVIAMLAGLAISNLDTLIRSAELVPAEQHFRDVVAEARLQAIENGTPFSLRFDEAAGQFSLRAVAEAASDSEAAGDGEDGLGQPLPAPEELETYRDSGASGSAIAGPEGEPTLELLAYPDLQVRFYYRLPVERRSDILEPRFADAPSDELRFSPSGAATPARVVFAYDSGDTVELTLDAFSAGPLPRRERDPYASGF
ncbi:MAG: Tfp pilus assembly protein FimT/FimU [Opitutales bacterium]